MTLKTITTNAGIFTDENFSDANLLSFANKAISTSKARVQHRKKEKNHLYVFRQKGCDRFYCRGEWKEI